jgi:hypothetical protein
MQLVDLIGHNVTKLLRGFAMVCITFMRARKVPLLSIGISNLVTYYWMMT